MVRLALVTAAAAADGDGVDAVAVAVTRAVVTSTCAASRCPDVNRALPVSTLLLIRAADRGHSSSVSLVNDKGNVLETFYKPCSNRGYRSSFNHRISAEVVWLMTEKCSRELNEKKCLPYCIYCSISLLAVASWPMLGAVVRLVSRHPCECCHFV